MSHLDNFVTYFVHSFIGHKYLFIFVLLLTFSTISVFWLTYDCSDLDQVYEDAYYDQETSYSLLDCLDIIVWNVNLNILAYCTSFFLGLGGIADTIINMGLIGIRVQQLLI